MTGIGFVQYCRGRVLLSIVKVSYGFVLLRYRGVE